MGKVEGLIAEEVAKYLKDGPSLAELNEGIKAFLASQKVQRSNDATLVAQILRQAHAGRTYAFYQDFDKKVLSLKPEEIQAAFRKLLDPSKLTIVEAGDFGKK